MLLQACCQEKRPAQFIHFLGRVSVGCPQTAIFRVRRSTWFRPRRAGRRRILLKKREPACDTRSPWAC